jgi:hypothetical protein
VQAAITLWLLAALVTTTYLVRRGAPPGPSALAALSVAALGVITLTPDGWFALGDPTTDCATNLTPAVTGLFTGPQQLANIAMVVPAALFAVLAGARPRTVAAVALLLPGVVEVLQALAVHRVCTAVDWLDNSAGGLLGVAAGTLLTARRVTSGPRPPAR